MARESKSRKVGPKIEEMLWTIVGAFNEVLTHNNRLLTDIEFYVLLSALKQAKPDVSKEFIGEFGAKVFLLVDMNMVRSKKDHSYCETYASFMIELATS